VAGPGCPTRQTDQSKDQAAAKLPVLPPSRQNFPAPRQTFFVSLWPTFVTCAYMEQYFKIGKLAASFGVKGELVLQHSLGKKTSLKGLEAIFLEEGKNNFLPYFIKATKIRNEAETIIQLEGVNIMEAARRLTPKEVWLTETDFKRFAAKASPIALLGFTMIQDDEVLGEIVEVIEQPHQVLCSIIYKGKETLIPIHAESLESVDQKARKVYVRLPDGLLELYQS
jgi:16S rRNA processing protein RimM